MLYGTQTKKQTLKSSSGTGGGGGGAGGGHVGGAGVSGRCCGHAPRGSTRPSMLAARHHSSWSTGGSKLLAKPSGSTTM